MPTDRTPGLDGRFGRDEQHISQHLHMFGDEPFRAYVHVTKGLEAKTFIAVGPVILTGPSTRAKQLEGTVCWRRAWTSMRTLRVLLTNLLQIPCRPK